MDGKRRPATPMSGPGQRQGIRGRRRDARAGEQLNRRVSAREIVAACLATGDFEGVGNRDDQRAAASTGEPKDVVAIVTLEAARLNADLPLLGAIRSW